MCADPGQGSVGEPIPGRSPDSDPSGGLLLTDASLGQLFNMSATSSAICRASSGGTALPTCTYCCVRLPSKKRSEEHTSELQSLMRISYAVFCLKKKKRKHNTETSQQQT